MPPVSPQPQQPDQAQQPDLDIVSHPVLGPLKFPKDMGPDERNQIIQQHMAEYKAKLPQAPASGSIAPPLTSPWEATKYGLKEFGGGMADVGKGIYDTFKPPETTGEKVAGAAFPPALPLYRMGKGLANLGQQAMQVPGAIKDLAASPDPLGTLALTAPRVGGQVAGTMIAQKAPEIAGAASEMPLGRMARSAWAGAKEAAAHTPIVGPMARAGIRGAMDAWNGPEPPTPRMVPPPPISYAGTRMPEQAGAPPVSYAGTRMAEPAPQAAPPPIRYSTNVAPEAPNKMSPPPPLRWGKTPGRMAPGANPNAPVTFVPEPRGLFTGEEPNYMASVPRGKLGKMALSRKPGAGTQMQQLGQPIIYIPGEADVPPPRR